MRVLLLAPPGAGKGTQGVRLAEALHVPHLATGDLLRQHVANESEIGKAAKAFMDQGEMVPDDLVIELVLGTIDGPQPLYGFVLDGFPRTLEQAEAAYAWAQQNGRTFNAVVFLDVDEDELVRRLVERGKTSGRADDNEETIRNRLHVYEELTAPLLEFYEGRGIVHHVDGVGTEDEIEARIFDSLGITQPG